MKEKEILCEIQRFTQKSRTGEDFALCAVCRSDFSVPYGGENDINRYKDISKDKGYVDTAQRQEQLTDFGASSATANPLLPFYVMYFPESTSFIPTRQKNVLSQQNNYGLYNLVHHNLCRA